MIPRSEPQTASGQAARSHAPDSIDLNPIPPSVHVSGLVKRYGSLTAVDGISFDVRPAEVFGLLGPNGAGKTTTVEVIEGLRDADAGDVQVLGLEVRTHKHQIKERIGVQLQSPSLFPRLRVIELMQLFARFFKHSLPLEPLIAEFGLEESRQKLVKHLSGGQQQRLSVALALVNDPEIVFLDEPTNGLDPQARQNLWAAVRGLQQRGKTILLTTHYMEEAERLCDRVAIVDQGRLVAVGTPRELIERAFTESAVTFRAEQVESVEMERLAAVGHTSHDDSDWTLYTSNVPATMSGLLTYTQAHGIQLEGLSVRGASLEDVFLKLTGRRFRD